MTGDLPKAWMQVQLGDVCLPVSKVDPRQHPDQEFEYIDIGGVPPGAGQISETKLLKGDDAPSRARQLVRAGDVVLSTVRTYQRKTAIVPQRLDGAVASTGFSVLRPHHEIVPEFILFQALSHEFVMRLSAQQTGTSYPAVRDRDVRAMSIRLPPLDEQKRIVTTIEEHFSRLDAVEAIQHRIVNQIDALRSSLLTEAFCLNGDLPSGWQRRSIGEVAEVQLGRQRSPQHHNGPQMRPYLRSANVTWDGISLTDVKEMNFDDDDFEVYRLDPGDLLLNEASGSPGEVGKPAIWDGRIENCCFQNTLLRIRSDEINIRYLYWYCYASALSGRFGDAGRGVNIRHLGKRGLSQFPIPIAPSDQQGEIADRLDQQFEQTRQLERTAELVLARVAALRQAVLSDAFSGRLVPQVPNDEPASALLERITDSR